MTRIRVPVFPGTNCEHETVRWLAENLDAEVGFLCPERDAAHDLAAIVVPGGFSYGDYLRAGAIAARGDAMGLIRKAAQDGVPVLGICNGFQILCEARLLPGVLVRNVTRQHHHFPVELEFTGQDSVWIPSQKYRAAPSFRRLFSRFALPMSCGMGRYLPSRDGNAPWRPVLSYLNNENGSTDAIAGIANGAGNVMGMMPHPERAASAAVGSTRGLVFLLGLAENRGLPIRAGSPLAAFARNLEEEIP